MGIDTVAKFLEDKGISQEEYLEFEKFVVLTTGIDPWLLNYATLETGYERFKAR